MGTNINVKCICPVCRHNWIEKVVCDDDDITCPNCKFNINDKLADSNQKFDVELS